MCFNGEEKLLQQKLGWTEAALVAGARDAGLSPAIVGSFPRKDAALVEVTKLLQFMFSLVTMEFTIFTTT